MAVNKCVYYSATGTGYIKTPSFAIPNTGILTIEAWMKSNFNASYQEVFSDDTNLANGFICVVRSGGYNSLRYGYSDGASRQYFSFSDFFLNLDNQWIHIITVSDYNNKTLKVYRNGIQFGNTQTLVTPTFPQANRIKYVGAKHSGDSKIIDGSLDEVRIYNRGLSAEEVYQHYLGNYADDTGLQLCYRMNDGSGTTVTDSSGFGRHGTMNGSTSWADFPPRVIL